MVFGRRRRMEAEVLDLVRAELTAIRTEVQTTLAESVSVLSARVRSEVEHRMGEPSALVAGIQEVRHDLVARDSEVVHALRRVVETCDALAERVQLDRIERSVLADAVNRLSAALAVGGPPPLPQLRATVIGGSVDPDHPHDAVVTTTGIEDDAALATEIDLSAEAAAEVVLEPLGDPVPPDPLPRDGVEVRCRFGDRWVTGFEVCEVIRFDDVTRYRLRRRSDGSVLPTLFEEQDLRFFTSNLAGS
jgi:hypothetical protein